MKSRQTSQGRTERVDSLRQQQLCVKTGSIHNYLDLEDLKENLLDKEPVIVIAKITPMVLKDREAATKLVNELYSARLENNYSVFRLGEERVMVIPNSVQVGEFKKSH